jgi:DNA-directed RNA polymerase specialized sigma24 family protein
VSRSSTDCDPLVAQLIEAAHEHNSSEAAVRRVVDDHAAPLIQRMLARAVDRQMLSVDDVQDLTHDVWLRLLVKLRQLVADPECEPISRFDDYVGIVVRHALEDHRRRVDPPRAKLARRVHYVLTHTPTLAVWGMDPVLCGVAEWRGRYTWAPTLEDWPRLPDVVGIHDLRTAVEQLLRTVGEPMRLMALIDTLAAASGLPGDRFVPLDALTEVAATAEAEGNLENRDYLAQLWCEIELLPLQQRRAMLLNLRLDTGDSIARALAALGVAGVRRQAKTLELQVEALLALWKELPLADRRIGSMLGLAPQQVVNLRKAARDRLARRMGRPRGPRRKGVTG